MISIFRGILVLLFLSASLFAQTKSKDVDPDYFPDRDDEVTIFKPTAGFGVGFLTFYGDIGSVSLINPNTPRIGYTFIGSTRLNSFLDFHFHALFGKLEANERSINRNLNFQSEIRSGGISVAYNFHHLLPKNRTIEPFISVGIESVEFLSKTDLFDARGNRYNYWSDGSIRSLPENHPNASNASFLQRDYVFETDIRESNFDGFGKYNERTFSVPVGAGVKFILSDDLELRIGTAMHFTSSNLIDGVTENSHSERKGSARNDRFLFSSFALSYRFTAKKKVRQLNNVQVDESHFDDVDFLALEMADTDGDGVRDMDDLCPDTPPGIPVDDKGCPIDTDGDGVADYLDKELLTPKGNFVDRDGVILSDSLIMYYYLVYMDTTGIFAKTRYTKYEAEGFIAVAKDHNYKVFLGSYKTGIPPDLINKYLSISDISAQNKGDEIIYSAGNFRNYHDAQKRMKQLEDAGLDNLKLVMVKGNKFISENEKEFFKPYSALNMEAVAKNTTEKTAPATSKTTSSGLTNTQTKENSIKTDATAKKSSNKEIAESLSQDGVVFRIQLGAYTRPLSNNVFAPVNDVTMVKSEDGLIRYLSGSFKDYRSAAKAKVDLLLEGFEGAFVVAYKNGERVPLAAVGATNAAPEDFKDAERPQSAINKKLITFRVQVGAFKNEVPPELMNKFKNIKNLETEKTNSGLTRYIAGTFNDYDKAQALKNEMIQKYGIKDAFIVANFRQQIIPINEALELIK
jgi:cell division septation protein DedD